MRYLVATLAILITSGLIAWFASLRNALLFLLGVGLAAALIRGHIGFTSAWRSFILERDARAFAMMLVLFMLASAVFIPTLASNSDTVANFAPLGISLVIGSFIFGIGMQLGHGCGSGTVVHAGSGSAHSLLTLLFFIIGSVLGSAHLPWWLELPGSLAPVVLPQLWGSTTALALQIALLVALLLLVVRSDKRHSWRELLGSQQIRRYFGAVAIVALAWCVLMISGKMWAITFAYTLWGGKAALLLGLPIDQWQFWQWDYPQSALENNLLADTTSVIVLGLFAGALALAYLRSALSAPFNLSRSQVVAAVAGGLLMGYGARLAFGCNIGALFSGIASGSLHAWIWFACAYLGSSLILLNETFAKRHLFAPSVVRKCSFTNE